MEIFALTPPQTSQNTPPRTEPAATASSTGNPGFRQELESAVASDSKNPESSDIPSAPEQNQHISRTESDAIPDTENDNSGVEIPELSANAADTVLPADISAQGLQIAMDRENNGTVFLEERIPPDQQEETTVSSRYQQDMPPAAQPAPAVISTEVKVMVVYPGTPETVPGGPQAMAPGILPAHNIAAVSGTKKTQPVTAVPQTTAQIDTGTGTPAVILSTPPAQQEGSKTFYAAVNNIILNSNETGVPTITLSSSPADSLIKQNTLAASITSIPGTLTASRTVASSVQAGGQCLSVTATITEKQILQPLTTPSRGERGKDTVRQSMAHQLVNAKLTQNTQLENISNQGELPGSQQDSNEFGSRPVAADTTTALLQSTITAHEKNTGIFSVPAFTTTSAGTSQIILQPPALPAAHYTMSEQEIMQQIYDKFHVNRNLPESRINMQLHPAELGELKIDISIREGNIKANVVAQSQMVQEVMEKNVGRLKTVLNEQGLNIEKITITARQQPKNDFTFQEQQFSGQNEQSSHNKNSKGHEESFNISRLTDDTGVTTTLDGVHLTA